jgi:hypothetical protein
VRHRTPASPSAYRQIANCSITDVSGASHDMTFGDHPVSLIRTSRPVLQSWKEIASELDRGVRTVQRWERTLGLPVHRLGKAPRCPVFAFKDELYFWLRSKADDGNCLKIERGFDQDHPQDEKALAGTGQSEGVTDVNPSQREIRPEVKCRAQIVESFKALFVAQSSRQGQQTCERCASGMQFLDGHFLLYGSEIRWKVSVPFCPICDIAILERFRHLQSIH